MGKMVKYFAYGSNLNLDQMQYRCPDHQFLGPMYLNNYRIQFRGPLDIEPSFNDLVIGAVFKVSQDDMRNLDRYEGFPRLYTKFRTWVYDLNGHKHMAWVYSMVNKDRRNPPSTAYFGNVKNGYFHCGIQQYVPMLHYALRNSQTGIDY